MTAAGFNGENAPFRTVVLGIAGCSGSGKSTLAAELAHTLDGVHFPIDHYYRDLGHLSLADRVRQNFDDPGFIEASLLAAHLAALARAKPSSAPSTISPPTRESPAALRP